VAESASASQHAQPTHCILAGTAGTFGVPVGVFSERKRFRRRAAHSSVDFGRVSIEGSESVSSSEEWSSVGVLGFRVDKLQNLVSDVWLEKRASVVAEASGRGLAQSG